MKYLIEQYHADVEAKDDTGYTSLHCASYLGYFPIVQYLVEQGHAKITKTDYRNKNIREYLESMKLKN